jgi:hypothetical protein
VAAASFRSKMLRNRSVHDANRDLNFSPFSDVA